MNISNQRFLKIPTLNYHHVHDEIDGYFRISPSNFRSQMEMLLSEGYKPIHADAIIKLNNESLLENKYVVITFDDGYKDFLVHALPILQDLNIKSTIFIITDHIGGWNKWDTSAPSRYTHLDIDELKGLKDSGVSFGSHTCSHEQLTALDRDAIRAELHDSKLALEDLLGAAIRTLAYPGGHHNQTVCDITAEYYDLGFGTFVDVNSSKFDPFRIERYEPTFCQDLKEFKAELEMRKFIAGNCMLRPGNQDKA